MQAFRYNEKKTIKNGRQSAILQNLSRFILVWYQTFCFIFMVQLFLFVFELGLLRYHKITHIQNGLELFAPKS